VHTAIAAYDDAIALLRRVIERRSKKPGTASEVQRVTDIVSFFSVFVFVWDAYIGARGV
jgi:hypothetical protein